MDRNQAKEFYPFLQAFAEGRVIECRTKPSLIEGTDVPNDWTEMKEIEFWNNIEYRIKPEAKYRPFKDTEECWEEMQKHQPFGWVKYADKYISISAVDSNNDYEIDFDDYTFADGTPFGVKVSHWLLTHQSSSFSTMSESNGLISPPCGVPLSGIPSPSISDFNILLMIHSNRLSRIPNVHICFSSFPWFTLSKKPLMSTSTQ